MKKLSSLLFAGSMALLFTACGAPQAQKPAETTPPATQTPAAGGGTASYDAAAAEAKYQSSCMGCHGKDLQGQVGPNLTAVGSKYSKDQIIEILKNGKGQMPSGLATGTDAENLAAWLADKK